MSKKMNDLTKHLYRSLRRKARLATKKNHLFRFQEDTKGEMWGKYIMYPDNHDKKILERIFPESIHYYLNNKFPFESSHNNLNIKYNMNKETDTHKNLYYEYTPEVIQSKDNPLLGDYNDENTNIKISRSQKKPTPQYSPLAKNIITEYDYYRLKKTIYTIFREHILSKNNDTQSLINDGFYILKEFDKQIEINECTSISEAYGIRIIVTSNFLNDIMPPEKKKPFGFCYRIRVENHGYEWAQLIGRHWLIKDENGNEEQVPRFQPGVVGVQPTISSGQIFIYGSGVFLNTKNGIMHGAFQFTNVKGELFEVPIAPFKLIAHQQNR